MNFNPGILLYVILVTSVVMALSLMVKGKDRENAEKLNFSDWDDLDREIEGLSKKQYRISGPLQLSFFPLKPLLRLSSFP
jgi:hypothetical protein